MKNSIKLFTLMLCVSFLAEHAANALDCGSVSGAKQAGIYRNKRGGSYLSCQNQNGGTIKSFDCASSLTPSNASQWAIQSGSKKCTITSPGDCSVTCG